MAAAASSSSTLTSIRTVSSSVKLSSSPSFNRIQFSKNFKPLISHSLKLRASSSTSLKTVTSNTVNDPKSSDSGLSKVQELHVYELNERDRGSPAYLRLRI